MVRQTFDLHRSFASFFLGRSVFAQAGLSGMLLLGLSIVAMAQPALASSARAKECSGLLNPDLPASRWVFVNSNGVLAHRPLPSGDYIANYSHAGYRGGGVAIPGLPVVKSLSPSGGDDTARIQAALDEAARRPLVKGLRGAVNLGPGEFRLSGSLKISASGVALRGSGSGADGTVLTVVGEPRSLITIMGAGSPRRGGAGTNTLAEYIPSGSKTINVKNAAGFATGDQIFLARTITPEWVRFMGMDQLIKDGALLTWLSPGRQLVADRMIERVSGNTITLDAPLTDAYNPLYDGPTGLEVYQYSYTGRLSEVGIEGFRARVEKPLDVPNTSGVSTHLFLEMDAVVDGWVKDVVAEDFNNGFVFGSRAKRVTIDRSAFLRKASTANNGRATPAAFSLTGQQILLLRSSVTGSPYFIATHANAQLNAFVDFVAEGTPIAIGAHQRWATGLLVDNVAAPTASIGMRNRHTMGTGHGWTLGFGVVWNSVMGSYSVQRPPGSAHWLVGSKGPMDSDSAGAEIELPGQSVQIKSLYLTQLCWRLGPAAVRAIGYDPDSFWMPQQGRIAAHWAFNAPSEATPPAAGIEAPILSADGLSFDGENDILRLPTAPAPATALAISVWVKPLRLNGTQEQRIVGRLVKAEDGRSRGYGFTLGGKAKQVIFYVHVGGRPVSLAVSASSLRENQWAHLTGTYDGSTAKLFVNGVRVAVVAASGTIDYIPALLCAGGGGGGRSCTQGRHFAGTMKGFTIWDQALAEEEVFSIYRRGRP